MVSSPYQTWSRTAAAASPPEMVATSSQHRQIVLQVRPRGNPAARANSPTSPILACVANPLASPVASKPLEPLFLGMDDDANIPTPLPSPFLAPIPNPMGSDYSPASLEINMFEVDARHPMMELMTPEHQAAWEAELARSPTPPPTANEVIDMVLDTHQLGIPVYRLEVHPLTPPPCWVEHQTPPPPPPD
ncbi:hypothetical protein NDA14_004576 [Ustilago hordei]|nr:hypothetical protein NDA12_002319 [Ustilago hordei]KAJ1582171.1 hypothetical protein NDA15_004240 [Ustilago hordei]KAJ1597816.1 hypothetical protein NDA14_004576 [Ustilago hordei]